MVRAAQTKPDPTFQRAIMIAAVVEGAFIVAGLAAYLLMHSTTWLIVLAGMGMVAFMAIFIPAFVRSRAEAAQSSQSPVVQDGEF